MESLEIPTPTHLLEAIRSHLSMSFGCKPLQDLEINGTPQVDAEMEAETIRSSSKDSEIDGKGQSFFDLRIRKICDQWKVINSPISSWLQHWIETWASLGTPPQAIPTKIPNSDLVQAHSSITYSFDILALAVRSDLASARH